MAGRLTTVTSHLKTGHIRHLYTSLVDLACLDSRYSLIEPKAVKILPNLQSVRGFSTGIREIREGRADSLEGWVPAF
jgi:hypothetical protein